MGKEFGCKSVDDNWVGPNVYSVVQMRRGSMSAIIAGDSETRGLVNLGVGGSWRDMWNCRQEPRQLALIE
jgi:hypothetical protein